MTLVTIIFAIMLAAVVVLTGVIVSHYSTLSDIEKKGDQILDAVRIFINETYTVTKDLDSNYQRAKEIRIARLKSMGQDPSIISTGDGTDGTDGTGNFFNGGKPVDELHDIQDETYVAHFMNILLHVLPLHDDAAMVEKITNTMEGWDSLMGLIKQANVSGIVANTSLLEHHVNGVLGNHKTKEVMEKSADLVEDVIDNRQKIVREYFVAKHQAENTLNKADALLQTPLVTDVMTKHAVLNGLGHLGTNLNDAMDQLLAFGHSDMAKEVSDDLINILGSAKHFHAIKYASQVLKLAADVGSRSAGIDLQKEISADNGEDFKKDAQQEAQAWMN
jgi:hypothetical protein